MDSQESRSKRAAAQNAGASIADQFGRYKRKRSDKGDDNEQRPRPTEEAAQPDGVSKKRKIKSSLQNVASKGQSDQDQADVAGANMKKRFTKSTRNMATPDTASGQQQVTMRTFRPTPIWTYRTSKKSSKAKLPMDDFSDDTSDHDEEPEQGEAARAPSTSKKAGKAEKITSKSRPDTIAAT